MSKPSTRAMPERPWTTSSQVDGDVEPDGRQRPHARNHNAAQPFAIVARGQYNAAAEIRVSFARRAVSTPARRVLKAQLIRADTVTELTPRRERILRHVVQEYVALAQPVPSDLIARKYEADLSPATVRNELAALEEAGLIAQPHTSAGRVPTDRGYRYFVELLMQEERELAPAERRTLRQQFNQLAAAGHRLDASRRHRCWPARCAARPSPPAPSSTHARVRRIELVPLEDDLVLVTLLMQSGGVRQVVHRADAAAGRARI